jgi:hypothetical protein
VQRIDTIRVFCDVPENDVPHLHVGDPAIVKPSGFDGPALNRASMLIDAAIDGQGIALARTALAAWDLINGCVARPFDLG